MVGSHAAHRVTVGTIPCNLSPLQEPAGQGATDADIPLPNEPEDRGYQSDDSRNVHDAGSEDEGEDLQENAERCCFCFEGY